MSAKNRNISIIEHISGYCNDIDELIQRFGNDRLIFKEDKAYCNAVCMCLLQIGELSKHLTEAFRTEHSEIPWKEIRGMRNIFAHDYGSIDVSEVWETIQKDIPILRGFCETIVRQYALLNEEALQFDDEDKSLWEKG
ncbi:HepT-like ribonuclease domain-containing protein [Eubacterium sp. 1001713B170207_170306_E7]|uniref:HepT-like ribonuclease domain-containing protein n=1 Tax=Eubacterium sp. 1001713B170207_170306_E7 TaxID=2787097 RepID=UPI0018977275|nr:HepT-like ribonuclease domain-containing protein [Eubacterium sp. 1001713B170207_170306_E7]